MAETALQHKSEPDQQNSPNTIREKTNRDERFERTFSFKVKNPGNVDVQYNTRSYSDDLNLRGNDVARHVHGVMKSSRKVLSDGTTEFTISLAKGFTGSAQVTINGQTTTLSNQSKLPGNNQEQRSNQELSALKTPPRRTTQPIIREGFKIASNIDGVTVSDVDKRAFPAEHAALSQAKSQGISIRLSDYTPGVTKTAAFQAFMKTRDSSGNEVEVSLGKTRVLTVSAEDYKQKRNAAMAELARSYMEHAPRVIASTAPGVEPITIDYHTTPDSWQRLKEAADNGISVSVVGTTTHQGKQAARIEAHFPDGSRRSTYMALERIGSNSETAYTLAGLSERSKLQETEGLRTRTETNTVAQGQQKERETSQHLQRNLRVRSVPGMPTVRLDPQRSPQLAAIAQTAKEGGLDLVRTKQEGNSVTIKLWSERLKKYAPGTFTIPKSTLEGQNTGSNSADMTRLAQEAQRLGKAYEWLIVDYPGTGAAFKQTVRDSLAKIPTSVIDVLIKDGQTIHLQKMMSQREQGFSDPPRGWSTPGWTESQRTTENLWDRVGGVYRPSKKEVIINESVLNSQLERVPESAARTSMTALHEVGHALGHALGHQALASGGIDPKSAIGKRVERHGISSATSFSRSYNRDIVMIPGMSDQRRLAGTSSASTTSTSPEKDSLGYFLQAGDDNKFDAGMSESFAQSFEVALVGRKSQYFDRFTRNFPQTLIAMGTILGNLEKEHSGG